MAEYLVATLVSFIVHFSFMIPFIDLLYRIKFQRANQHTKDAFNKPTPIFDKFHKHKVGTPVGGGILIIIVTTVLYILTYYTFVLIGRTVPNNYLSEYGEIFILLFTFISFSMLGIYDDVQKIFKTDKGDFFGIRLRHKLIIEIVLAFIIAYWIYLELDIKFIHIPFFNVIYLDWWYVVFAAFVIVAFSNAVNITDGLDGLAAGLLMITLVGFWVISSSISGAPTSIFIAVWLGGLIAFLYFNVYPARIFMGDSGALAFGATFAVIGLILGKSFALPIIGGVFVIEIATSLFQLLSKSIRKKKLFPVAPLHLWFQLKGWEEPKIVIRMWIFCILFVIFGVMVAYF